MAHVFSDAQKLKRDHPKTFGVPTVKQLAKLKKGYYVKVSHNEERFWVILTEVRGKRLKGTVTNALVYDQPFSLDDTIIFEKRHVYNILDPKTAQAISVSYESDNIRMLCKRCNKLGPG